MSDQVPSNEHRHRLPVGYRVVKRSVLGGFYEKVVKVKADVAAILKFFLLLRSRRSRPTITTRPRWCPSGGCARGVSAERFETPLAGGAAAAMCASAVCWRAACQRRGGNPPAPAFPQRGETGKGEIRLPCCRRQFALASCECRARRWFTVCSLFFHVSLHSDHQPIG